MQQSRKKLIVLSSILVLAAISRLIPHPMNFAPLAAMALFGAAYFGNRGLGLLVTMGAWFLSDLVLNNLVYDFGTGFQLFTSGAFYIYLSVALIFGIGALILKKISFPRIVIGSFIASILFFLVSNFGVWSQGIMYPMTTEGLIACYIAGLPYIQNTLMGDLFFSVILFFLYERLLGANLIPKRISK
jgi:hypothetical protein